LAPAVESEWTLHFTRYHVCLTFCSSFRIILYAAQDPEKQQEVADWIVPAAIQQIRYHCDQTFVALANGTVMMFRRGAGGDWNLQEPQSLLLGTEPVTSLLPINICMYAACGKKVWVINSLNGDMQVNSRKAIKYRAHQ
jgi:Rho guanine nucleotide exchange factor 10